MAQSVASARIGSFRFFSARAILAQCLGTAHRATAPHSANCRARPSQFCSEVADGVGFEPTADLRPRRFSRPVP